MPTKKNLLLQIAKYGVHPDASCKHGVLVRLLRDLRHNCRPKATVVKADTKAKVKAMTPPSPFDGSLVSPRVSVQGEDTPRSLVYDANTGLTPHAMVSPKSTITFGSILLNQQYGGSVGEAFTQLNSPRPIGLTPLTSAVMDKLPPIVDEFHLNNH